MVGVDQDRAIWQVARNARSEGFTRGRSVDDIALALGRNPMDVFAGVERLVDGGNLYWRGPRHYRLLASKTFGSPEPATFAEEPTLW